MMAEKRLGRGLAALIGDVGEEGEPVVKRRASIEALRPNPRNPRKSFSAGELDELATSIKERGVIQPIVVRAVAGARDGYEIIAGERRWRAAQRAGLHEVPIAVVEATDKQALEFAIIENVQRADLNPIEEASGYHALIEEHGHSQDEVAQIVGKSRPHVANTIRLLKLPEPVKVLLRAGKLSAGHARLLVGEADAERIAQRIVDTGMSVRQLESEMRKSGVITPQGPSRSSAPAKDADTVALERKLSNVLGLDVSIDHRGASGTLHIKYKDLDQLDAVLRKLGG